MMKARKAAMAAMVVGALALSGGSAWASGGGVNSGGVNSGGVNAGGTTTGGGGGGSGGGGSTASCVRINSFSDSVGYYSVFAAIWTQVSLTASCSGSGAVTYRVTYLNTTTGVVDFTGGGTLRTGSVSSTIDEDWAAFSTPYTVTLTVTDSAGTVQAQQSHSTLTPAERAPGA